MSIANKKPRLFNFVVSILSAMSLPLHIFLTQAVQLLFRKQLTTKSIDISDKETDISVKVTSEGGIALHNYSFSVNGYSCFAIVLKSQVKFL